MGADVGGGDAPKSEPNVVPLCDILLVLLIIFMVITPLLKKGAHLKLPEAANTGDQPESGTMITVYIQKNSNVLLGSKAVAKLDDLVQMIEDEMEEKKQSENKVLLRADAEVPYGKVTEVMDLIRQAQIEFVGLVTDPNTSGN
ncbi:MAG: biopolymer transporter ExbD [bacterium]|nr:biopolymer transporter ExbD [bacterium]